MKKEIINKRIENLFLILILIIPLNLGKHFLITDSYVSGILIDYLIPSIYVQDILVLLIVLLWIFSGGLLEFKKKLLLSRSDIQILILFIFCCLLSVFSAQRQIPSMYFWIRLFLYFLLFTIILCEIKIEKSFFKILNVISASVIFTSLLGVLQFLKQGSVFSNYTFFGEQPYSSSTYGIAREAFFGSVIVPSYSTFRHPNVFGGFLCIFLLWFLPYIKGNKRYIFTFVIGLLALLATFSLSAWIAFAAGVLIHFMLSLNPSQAYFKKIKISAIVIAFCLSLLAFSGVNLFNKSQNPSIFRRSDLVLSSYKMALKYPLFGVGINNFTVLVDNFYPKSPDIRFTQPVHNVFALILSETGVFAYSFFVIFLLLAIRNQLNPSVFNIFFISIIQLLILFSLDHYFFTINQALLMFWIVMGLSFSYNK